MDRIIGSYPAVEDGDLFFCSNVDIAYQKDMTKSVSYDKDYYENYVNLEGTKIANALNAARVGIVEKYCGLQDILDVGIGSGAFIKSMRSMVYGYDINPYGVSWLKDRYRYINPWENIPSNIRGITLWDTLEHMTEPSKFLDLVPSGVHVFISMPMFSDIKNIRKSKHYKPNEHYYYYSPQGFTQFVEDVGYKLLEQNDQETKAGRTCIETFVLLKK
jgi:hypothetical protein